MIPLVVLLLLAGQTAPPAADSAAPPVARRWPRRARSRPSTRPTTRARASPSVGAAAPDAEGYLLERTGGETPSHCAQLGKDDPATSTRTRRTGFATPTASPRSRARTRPGPSRSHRVCKFAAVLQHRPPQHPHRDGHLLRPCRLLHRIGQEGQEPVHPPHRRPRRGRGGGRPRDRDGQADPLRAGPRLIADIATIASLNILGEVAKKTAQYDTPLHRAQPRPDRLHRRPRDGEGERTPRRAGPTRSSQDSVFFVTDQQFAYAAAVDGIMTREKPATNFLLGMFWAESLILAETGAADRRHPDRRHRRHLPAPVLHHRLRLHAHRRGTLRRLGLPVARAAAARLAQRAGLRQAHHPRHRDRRFGAAAAEQDAGARVLRPDSRLLRRQVGGEQ